MKRKLCVVLLWASILMFGGCAAGRMADLRDCGRASVGYGFGLGAEASLGIIGNPSLGIMSGKAMSGIEDRRCAGMWLEEEFFYPASSIISAMMRNLSDGGPASHIPFAPYGREMYPDFSLGYNDGFTYTREKNFLIVLPQYDSPPKNLFQTTTDWEIGATAGFISARIGINPLEIFDFILGLLGCDIAGDDLKPNSMETVEELAEYLYQEKMKKWRSWRNMGEIVNPLLAEYLRMYPDKFLYETGDDEANVVGFSSFLRSRLSNTQALEFDTNDRLLDPWGDPVHFIVDRNDDMKLTARGQQWDCANPEGNEYAVGLLLDNPKKRIVCTVECDERNPAETMRLNQRDSKINPSESKVHTVIFSESQSCRSGSP